MTARKARSLLGARAGDGGRNSIATTALSPLLDHRPIPQSATRHYAWPTTVFPLLLATCSLSIPHSADIAYAAQQFTQTNRLPLWHICTPEELELFDTNSRMHGKSDGFTGYDRVPVDGR
jgi:hypothetical protein